MNGLSRCGAGLDSTTAMNLVTSLCQLAAGGRAVVTTIHQPSSRLYQQLDKLLLLSEGHAMYYGKVSLSLSICQATVPPQGLSPHCIRYTRTCNLVCSLQHSVGCVDAKA